MILTTLPPIDLDMGEKGAKNKEKFFRLNSPSQGPDR